MEIIKKTVTREEITGYKAFDGSMFTTELECMKYELSAQSVAKRHAWQYLVDERYDYDLLHDDTRTMMLFDIVDADAYRAVCLWMELNDVYGREDFSADYIGKRVGLCNDEGDLGFSRRFATKDSMLSFYTEHIERLFADKDTAAN